MLNGFGRTPQGVRGLKLLGVGQPTPHTTSHPARGAWIEIINGEALASATASRTPQGVRGLKSIVPLAMPHAFSSRTPQGVRGLKLISVK